MVCIFFCLTLYSLLVFLSISKLWNKINECIWRIFNICKVCNIHMFRNIYMRIKNISINYWATLKHLWKLTWSSSKFWIGVFYSVHIYVMQLPPVQLSISYFLPILVPLFSSQLRCSLKFGAYVYWLELTDNVKLFHLRWYV